MYVLKQPRSLALCALVVLFLTSVQAADEIPTMLVTPPPSPATQYVRDLLILDAAAALRAEAEKAQTYNPVRPRVPDDDEVGLLASPRDVVRLKAILGVGQRLSALLDINGQAWLYRTGRAAPVGGPHAGIRLVKITTPCAEFLLPDGQSDIHCISEAAP